MNSPGTGISFNSSGSLQSAINANPSLSTFVCSTTTPVWNSSVDTGTKVPTIIFPGAPGQCIIDAGGGEFTAVIARDGTTIQGGTWRNIGTTFAFAYAFSTQNDVSISDVIAHNCLEVGANIQGLNNTISHCRFHTNGRYGVNTGTTVGDRGDGLNLEYCEIDNNNTRNLHGGDAAGTKFAHITTGQIHHNYVHDNNGFGIWPDTGNLDLVIEENVMEGNHFSGMMYEANAASVMRHNYVANNGDWTAGVGTLPSTFENNANVRISDSNCTAGNRGQFQNNIIDFTPTQTGQKGGLLLLWDHSGTTARSVQNWDIHHNQLWLRGSIDQRVGGEDTAPIAFPVWSSGNSFFLNEYHVASLANSYWKWDAGTGQGVTKTYAEWQAFHPGETVARSVI